MASADENDDVYNTPMLASDAAAMLRRKVQRNDRPYVADTTKLNNRKVDSWKKSVLDEISGPKGLVPSGRVWPSWQLYDEGLGVLKYQELKAKGLIPAVDPEVLEYWKDFFENLTVEEMHSYGSGVVSFGWGLIQNYLKMWYADQKYEALFSKFETPLEWERNHHPHKLLLEGRILPFWNEEMIKDIQQKVAAVLMNQVRPQGGEGGFR